ncbi:MAG: MBL fold metallo-hydrolase [Acidobacteria bacterium]|nr:MBL fold metallo-hydrolase [Acidobacteriota bacterium]
MQIQFLNHASVKLITSQVRVTTDPWYSGAAFNNGWDLIRTDGDLPALASDATHFWLSHEHPDHLSIEFFKSLSNRSAPVLFQKTADQRVVSFLRGQGFTVEEIPESVDLAVAPGETMRVGRCGFYDSWSLFRAGGDTILNLNDCEINDDRALDALRSRIGTIDVLLTQFSYAAWKGGRENRSLRQIAARDKLDTVGRQIRHLKPKFVIPFASFVYFSHVENSYLNDSINDVPGVINVIESSGSTAVVMKPRDTWRVGEAWNNREAIDYWREAYASIPSLPRRFLERAISFAELAEHGRQYQQRVFRNNAKWLIWLASFVPVVDAFRPILIRLTDLRMTVRFSFFASLEATDDGTPDVEMSSENLDFIFLNEFGYDTLTVNGRFEASTSGFARMTKNFAVGSLNALGLGIKPSLILNADVVLLLLKKLRSFLQKIERSSVRHG